MLHHRDCGLSGGLLQSANMGEYHNTAIVFDDIKDALIYYDYIIPLGCFGFDAEEYNKAFRPHTPITEYLSEADSPILRHVLPDQCQHDSELLDMILSMRNSMFTMQFALMVDKNEEDYESARHHYITTFKLFLTKYNVSGSVVDCQPSHLSNSDTTKTFGTLNIAGMGLVDIEDVPIGEILELRKDKVVVEKMRAFRLFAYNNYFGKSKAYIEDDIQNRWNGYQVAVKEWGFETKQKAISFLLKNTPLMVGTVGAIVKAFTGSTETALLAGASGLIAELGLLKLEFARQHHALANIASEHPISYISDVKKKLENKGKVDRLK